MVLLENSFYYLVQGVPAQTCLRVLLRFSNIAGTVWLLTTSVNRVKCSSNPHISNPFTTFFTTPPFSLRRALTLMKIRLKSAVQGHSLLKKKSDALKLKFRKILGQIVET